MEEKKIIFLFIFFFLLMNSFCFVKGFGLSMSYNDKDRPLIVSSGEVRDIDFALLSSARESNKSIGLDIVNGSEIASLEKNEFELLSGGEEKGFIKIIAPIVEKDKDYLVTLSIKEISSGENNGTVGFSFSSTSAFIVRVIAPEKKQIKFNNLFLILPVVFILLILLIIFIIYLKLRKKEVSTIKRSKYRF
jgi:hypothetical protein